MNRGYEHDDNDDEDEDDLPDGVYHDDELATIPCPFCQETILEDVPRCPHCGNYLSGEDAPPQPRSKFLAVMMILALLIVLTWIMA